MSDPPADTTDKPPRRPSVAIPDTNIKQESPSPGYDDSAGTASHASATSPSSDAPSPGSPSTTPCSKDLHEENGQPVPSQRERRKRSRVSPEQLAVLEAIFAADRSPTAVRRKEISDQLGMNERQTQIWFQNRRAKAKQADNGKVLSKTNGSSLSPTSPPAASPRHQIPRYPSQDLDLKKRIHEDDPVIVIPCTELSIGGWTRVSSAKRGRQHDLLAYVCETRRRLTWYVHYHEADVEHSVKMDISFDAVADITLTQLSADTAHASIRLSQPPAFYMEVRAPDARRAWLPCGDWTAHQQATSVLQHELSGACAPLTYLCKRLRAERHAAPPLLYTPPPSVPIPRAAPPPQDLYAFSHGFAAPRLQPIYDGFGSYPPASYSSPRGSPPFAYAYPGSLDAHLPASLTRRTHALFVGEPPPEENRLAEGGVASPSGGLVAPVPETPIDIGAFWMNVG